MPNLAILPPNSAFQAEFLSEFSPKPIIDAQQHDRFHQVFVTLLDHTNNTQLQAEQRMTELEAGQDNLIETVMSIQKASQTMSMLIQVRNHVIEGYHEVLNQQI